MLYVYYLAAFLIFSFWSLLTGKNQQESGGGGGPDPGPGALIMWHAGARSTQ